MRQTDRRTQTERRTDGQQLRLIRGHNKEIQIADGRSNENRSSKAQDAVVNLVTITILYYLVVLARRDDQLAIHP